MTAPTITQAEALELHRACLAANTTLPAVAQRAGLSAQYGQTIEDLALGCKRTEAPALAKLTAAVKSIFVPKTLMVERGGNTYTVQMQYPPAELLIVCHDGRQVFQCTGEQWGWLLELDIVKRSNTPGWTYLFHGDIDQAVANLAACP